MGGFLSFVICLALSAGLGLSAYRKSKAGDRRGATRMGAWALVPMGLELAGFVRLGRKVGDAVGHWGMNLVFNPLVWIGIAMLGVAVVTLLGVGFTGDKESDDSDDASQPVAKPRSVGPGKQSAPTGAGDDAEIDAILRKHGVS